MVNKFTDYHISNLYSRGSYISSGEKEDAVEKTFQFFVRILNSLGISGYWSMATEGCVSEEKQSSVGSPEKKCRQESSTQPLPNNLSPGVYSFLEAACFSLVLCSGTACGCGLRSSSGLINRG